MKDRSIEKPKILIIQGPTGIGKTAIALGLSRHLPVEIINADSMQFYRHMDIGTSKPAPEEQEAVPHHLFSIVNPDEQFNAAQFVERAGKAIADIVSRNAIPLVVGGTGLYIRALTGGLCHAPEADESLRSELRREGRHILYERLQAIDPDAAQRINPNDLVRIIRALEVYYLTGEPLSRHQRSHRFQDEPYACLKIGLAGDRKILYGLIEQRVDQMIARGLEQEVRALIDRGFAPSLRAMQSIGYRQMSACVQGSISLDEAAAEIKKQTKRFAKRQLTWLRHDAGIVWISLPDKTGELDVQVKKFLDRG